MERFTYTEPRNLQEASAENPCVATKEQIGIIKGIPVIRECGAEGKLCDGCNLRFCEKHGKMIDAEFYCDGCRVCVCCGEPAVMDEGNGMTCSPSRMVASGVTIDPVHGPMPTHDVICNGSADDEAERINEAKERAYDAQDEFNTQMEGR